VRHRHGLTRQRAGDPDAERGRRQSACTQTFAQVHRRASLEWTLVAASIERGSPCGMVVGVPRSRLRDGEG
jgi:hypothetical protein